MQYEDAYGHIVWNYFKGLPSFSVIERDDGYMAVDQGAKDYLAHYKEWGKHERAAIAFAEGRCLDIGCSAGRVLLYLQGRGLRAVGIDTSPLSIKVCKLRGARGARLMGIEQVNKFKRGTFDSITMFGYNFGLFGNVRKAKSLLHMMHKITSQKGTIIAETRDPHMTDNPVHHAYIKRNVKNNRMPGLQRIRNRFMQYSTPWYDYLYISKKEMKSLLLGTGWKVDKFIDSENHKEDGRYFAIIKKTKEKPH